MNKTQSSVKFFYASLFSFFVMSVTIFFMPLASDLSTYEDNTAIYLCGGLFWLSFLLGWIFWICLSVNRKKHIKPDGPDKRSKKKGFNSKTKAFFVIFLISLLSYIVILFTELKFHYISIVVLFIVVFSFCLTLMFSGKNYRYIKSLKRGEYQ